MDFKNNSRRKGTVSTVHQPQRSLLVGVELPHADGLWSLDDSLIELAQLARTAGLEVMGSLSQRLRSPNAAYYLGRGKVEELLEQLQALQCEVVIVDDELSPSQQRNLEEALKVQVMDRNELILQVFAQRARTHEGRLQVELARLEYALPRLVGQWTHLERQAGATQTRGGPGETQLEVDRRRVRQRIGELKVEIEKIRRHRTLYREKRAQEGLLVIALVGYTNAGKSTLLNALTSAEVLSEDKLFATLDPTTRRLRLPSSQEALLTDTVGFIQKLPHSLIAAFRATLEELGSADVLLHVVDVTHPNGFEQAQTVVEVLDDLDLQGKPIVTALNKIDALSDDGRPPRTAHDVPYQAQKMLAELAQHYPNAVPVSARNGWGLVTLLAKLEAAVARRWIPLTVRLPYTADRLIHLFHQRARIVDESYNADGVLLTGEVPERYLAAFDRYVVA